MNNRLIARRPEHCDDALVNGISEQMGIPDLVARALIRRGVATCDAAEAFLRPSEKELLDAFLLPDMAKAVSRIRAAIQREETICVYGDYDADGVCSTAMLTKRLQSMGACVQFYIPLRHSEGYGMNERAVRRLKERGVSLVITVDNGISAFDEIALCSALGMDVIVTDHHSVGKAIPECVAVVAVSRKDSVYPNRYLCGAGVALKLIQGLTGGQYTGEELALAAVATVADVVPLVGENRTITSLGIDQIANVCGFAELLNAAGFQQGTIDEQTISYLIAPRLNAAGRMASAAEGVELLLNEESGRTKEIACRLNEYNQKRKDTENGILEEAERQIAQGLGGEHVLILLHEDWNPGVIGIVASRLCERLHIPVILFAEQEGVLTGSGRSIEGVDLYENLSAFSHLYLRYGGHARAAGVTIRAERYEEFKKLFSAHIEANYHPEDFFPSFEYDETLPFEELSVNTVRALKQLAPFGEGNPEPVFRFNNVRFASVRTIGKDDKHFCASALQTDQVLRVVAFGKSELLEPLGTAADWDLVAEPNINAYRGRENVELFWICANASEEKVKVFNDFFIQNLYNESCSFDLIANWVASFQFGKEPEFGDTDMRKYYRVLTQFLAQEPRQLNVLIRTLKTEEMFALCVFTQLSFFAYDPETRLISQNENVKPRTLSESPLYRMMNNRTEEA